MGVLDAPSVSDRSGLTFGTDALDLLVVCVEAGSVSMRRFFAWPAKPARAHGSLHELSVVNRRQRRYPARHGVAPL
jgi:hypothetical protein